jgi:hypothetical protein
MINKNKIMMLVELDLRMHEDEPQEQEVQLVQQVLVSW